MKIAGFLLAVLTILSPLTTHAQAQSSAEQCLQNIESGQAFLPLKGKLATDVEKQTIEMLVNKQKATPEERKAVLFWDLKRTECIKERE